MSKKAVRGKPQLPGQDADLHCLLKRLEQGGVIVLTPEGGFQLQEEGGSGGRPIARRYVEACLAADWLERQGAVLVLSETGRFKLRRYGLETDAFLQQHQCRATSEREINGTRRLVTVNEGKVRSAGSRAARIATGGLSLAPLNSRPGSVCAQLLVCAFEPAGDLQLVGTGVSRAIAPRCAIKSGGAPP